MEAKGICNGYLKRLPKSVEMREVGPREGFQRGNIVPILADARKPQDYTWIEPADILYQDVAIPDQSEILIRNARVFLKPDGFAMIAIKSRSIDVVRPPQQIYKEELKKLSEYFKVLDKKELDPYEKDHMFVVMKPKA